VEFAIVLSLFLVMLFGILEVGRVIMVHQVITNAAREGARRAVVPGATDEQVQAIVDGYLGSAGVSGHTRTVFVNGTEASLSTAASHDSVAVSVAVPYGQVSWGFMAMFDSDRVFRANVVMRKE
jgi:Flp pilus assembly protein TadG